MKASRRVRALVLTGASLVGLGASEALLRTTGFQYSPVRIGDSNSGDHRETHAFHDRYLTYDRDLIWRPLSGQFSPFNPQGFRGASLDRVKTPGTRRVFAIGDSNTFGWAVDEGANWPEQLGRLLETTHPTASVVNAGVWGYTAYQGLQRFREVLAYEPDVVLVSFGANDAHQVEVPDLAYVRQHDRLAWVARTTRFSRLAQLVVAAWDRASALARADAPLTARVPVADYERYLRDIITTAKGRGIRVVLLTRPFQGASSDPRFWKTFAPDYNQATLAIAAAEGVPVVDVYRAFRDRPDLFADESHFGVEGHRLAAEFIATVVRDELERLGTATYLQGTGVL